MVSNSQHTWPLRPSLSLAAAVCMVGLLGSTPTASALVDSPSTNNDAQASTQAPAAPESANSKLQVEVENPDGTLKSQDEQFLIQETQKIKLPPSVKGVTYLVIDGNSDKLNDDVLQWAGANRPDLVPDGTGKGATWKLGQLIVAVSTEKRHNGIYCGNDVCSDLKLSSGETHLERSLDDMKPSLKDGRWSAGLLEGTKTAADPSKVKESSDTDPLLVLGGVGAAGAVVGGGFYVMNRSSKTRKAKEQFDYISTTYGETAQRLDEIDIRANSLTSPLAHAELREQWDKIRSDFIAAHHVVDRLGLTPDSPDKDFYAKRHEIHDAYSSLSTLENADKNINLLFDMERGDSVVRRREIATLREDIAEARNAKEIKVQHLVGVESELAEADQQLRALEGDLNATDFMDRFALALRKHGHAMKQLGENMKKLKLEQHTVPDIGASTWRPGYGYNGWYPYVMLSSWHSSDVSAATSSSSSGVNTSFSSGFSGGGGSSSF